MSAIGRSVLARDAVGIGIELGLRRALGSVSLSLFTVTVYVEQMLSVL